MYSKVTKTIELYKTAAYRFWQGYFQRFVDLRVYSYIYSYIQSSLIEKLRKLAATKRKTNMRYRCENIRSIKNLLCLICGASSLSK